jgi:sulfoquinovose isomerase
MEETGMGWMDVGAAGPDFTARPVHRQWLLGQALDLFRVFGRSTDPAGGFYTLDAAGQPRADGLRQIHETTRMVHCQAIGLQLGLPGAAEMVDHGMRYLWARHRDAARGGYHWSLSDDAVADGRKQAYGHAFVLLAASSAKVVGHPDADRLLADVSTVIRAHFWDEAVGASREEFDADWNEVPGYRGQNANMHLTEALMAAYEATGEAEYLTMAERIATLIIQRHAQAQGWRVAEHFHADWTLDRDYAGDPMFRPAGTTPGHALEWARLLIQLWHLGGHRLDWLRPAAEALFRRTVEIGWDKAQGGFYYTLDWEDVPSQRDRYWWPCAEGIGAAAVLHASGGDAEFEGWYRRIWGFTAQHLIDPAGGWYPELGADDLRPISRVFDGKPDIYHALQACLIPLVPPSGSLTRGLREGLVL